MKETAIEWLESKFNEFETIDYSLPSGLYEYVNQAKEMEKEQIIDAYETSHISMMTAKQYYNETFKNK